MKIISVILMATLTAAASAQNLSFGSGSVSAQEVTAKDIAVVVVVQVKEVNPYVSTAVYCTIPGCNTVYMDVQKLIPFKSAAEAVRYLNDNKDVKFLRLLSAKDMPLKVDTTVENIPQPPQTKTATIYRLAK